MRRQGLPLAVVFAAATSLGACARFSPDGGMSPVAAAVRADLRGEVGKIRTEADFKHSRERIAALLTEPLTAESVVQIALLGNRDLQAAFNDLGISEADYVAAALPPNPRLSVSRIAGGGIVEIEAGIVANILLLLTIPARREIAAQEFSLAQYRAIEVTFRVASDARRAYIRAAAAREAVNFLERARNSADAAADLMRRLGETGAANRLDQARAAALNAETAVQLARARLVARQEREALVRILGLWGVDTEFRLGSLPPLPTSARAMPDIEKEAVQRRVDMTMGRLELAATARSLGLTEATGYVSLLELGGMVKLERERTPDGTERARRFGPELELEIPLFDFGEVRRRRAQEIYYRSLNRLAARAVQARSEARAAYQAYRATHDIARQFQNSVVPLRRTVSEEALLRYNGMLIDVFELLTTVREQVSSTLAAIEARRDFLLAEIDVRHAVIGGGSRPAEPASASVPASPVPAAH